MPGTGVVLLLPPPPLLVDVSLSYFTVFVTVWCYLRLKLVSMCYGTVLYCVVLRYLSAEGGERDTKK